MPKPAASARKAAGPVYLLDGNVLLALTDASHVHHGIARDWFSASSAPFATCPITQGTLLRLTMHLGGARLEQALALLDAVTGNARHRFWPDALPYDMVRWRGVVGHRQVTDAYLAELARHHGGKFASLDRGLVALHPDVAVEVQAG